MQARASLTDFAEYIYPYYETHNFHALIASHLEAVDRGDIKRLIISVPPRSGKSELASVLFPPWYLGRNPNKRIIACSYAESLVKGFGRRARNIVQHEDYRAIFPDVNVSNDSRSVTTWSLAPPFYGMYVGAGVGGPITGKGCDVLIIDDPIKDAEEAGSRAILENIWEWYGSTAYTRLEHAGAVIMIMTRWTDDDLIGRVLEKQRSEGGERWTELVLPAIAEADDALGREPGEALWPEKYSVEDLERIKGVLGSRVFSALYQQNPVPAGGNIWKKDYFQTFYPQWNQEYVAIEAHLDTALKAKESNDYSACVLMGKTPNNDLHLLDCWWERLEFPGLIDRIKKDYNRWAQNGIAPQGIYIEDKGSGTSAVQTLINTTSLPVVALPVNHDKVYRANSCIPYYEQHRVFHPPATILPQIEEYETFLERFPRGKHDDPADATSQAVNHLMGPQEDYTQIVTIDDLLETDDWRISIGSRADERIFDFLR